jgi:putative ABC transport system permease protein
VRRVALKGLAQRKLRALLTAISIVLGVAMISGSLVLTDTISKAFDTVFSGAYEQTDAVVSGRKLVDWSASGNATVPESVLDRIRALPEVEAAAGAIMDIGGDSTQAKILDRDGKAIQASGNPTFAFGVDPAQPRFNPMTLVAGAWASGSGEVVIDEDTASGHGFAVGDRVRVAGNGPTRAFTVSGVAKYGDVASLGGATFAIFDVPTAREVLDIAGFTTVSVAAKEGVAQEVLVAKLTTAVPDTVQVRTGSAQAQADKQGIESFVSFIRGFLLAFGGVALLVGSFVIFNTLSITVAQRVRELATLRTLGASRRQVLRSVVLESLVLGLVASVVGLFAGFGLAKGLSALFKTLGLDLPQADPVYATRTFVVALVVGVLVTVLAGLGPALKATRVPPIAAVREGATLSRSRRLGPVAGVVMQVVAFALLADAVIGGSVFSGRSLLELGVGMLLLLVGASAVAPRLVTALAAVVGLPSRRFGGSAGRLAVENAVRNPSRTAATAAALMIGLALVSFVAVLGAGVRTSLDDAVGGQVQSPWVVTSQNGWSAFPRGAGDAAARADGVTRVSSIRTDRARIGEVQVNVNAVDPETVAGLYRFAWTDGTDGLLSRLGRDGAVVKRTFARTNGLEVGDTFRLTTASGADAGSFRVLGIYQPPRLAELLGGVVISQDAFDAGFDRPRNFLTLVDGATSRAALEQALAPFPDAKVQTHAEYVENQSSFIGSFLNLLYVLLALSVVVSLFGMINTLVLSVFERTRELGMLRAVGLTRRQTRRMVRHESVITALIGAGLGLPLGILLGAAVTHGLSPYGVSFTLPLGPLVVFAVVAALCGVLAAVAPARRAARLNVLEALQYE